MSLKLCGFALIDWIIRRSKKSKMIDKLFLATTNNNDDKFLIKKAEHFSINSYAGDENDVLSRFIEISEKEKPDTIVRICADNPLISPFEIDRIIESFLQVGPDYAFNHIPKLGNNYVDGAGAEVLSVNTLKRLKVMVKKKVHKEHVTKFIWDNTSKFSIHTIKAPQALQYPQIKLDIDTNSDLKYLEGLIGSHPSWNYPEDILVSTLLKNFK